MRFFGLGNNGGSGLEADLRTITNAELIDVPSKEVLRSIVTATHDAADRREIMRHVNECLSERSAQKWRRIHGGLVLLEQLLQRGAPALITETAEGHHFDIVQRLTFLANFAYPDDLRVQQMLRQKAAVLRSEWIQRIQGSEDVGWESAPAEGHIGDGVNGKIKEPTVVSAPSRPPTQARAKYVNGIVSVGHRDETDSDSSEAESKRRQGEEKGRQRRGGQQRREQRSLEERRRNVLDESTDSDSSGARDNRNKATDSRSRRRDDGHAPKPPANTALAAPAAPAITIETNLLDM